MIAHEMRLKCPLKAGRIDLRVSFPAFNVSARLGRYRPQHVVEDGLADPYILAIPWTRALLSI